MIESANTFDGFADIVCVFLYEEEKIENRYGEKCCYFLLFQRGKLSWRCIEFNPETKNLMTGNYPISLIIHVFMVLSISDFEINTKIWTSGLILFIWVCGTPSQNMEVTNPFFIFVFAPDCA